jgi:hypothetical protein
MVAAIIPRCQSTEIAAESFQRARHLLLGEFQMPTREVDLSGKRVHLGASVSNLHIGATIVVSWSAPGPRASHLLIVESLMLRDHVN